MKIVPLTPEEEREAAELWEKEGSGGGSKPLETVSPGDNSPRGFSFAPLTPEDEVEARRLWLNDTVRHNIDESPDAYAEKKRLANDNDWPPSMLDDQEYMKEAKTRDKLRDLADLPESYPKTSSALSARDIYGVFADDVISLREMENIRNESIARIKEAEVKPFWEQPKAGYDETMALYRYSDLSRKERTEGLTDQEQTEWGALLSVMSKEPSDSLWDQVLQGAGKTAGFQVKPLKKAFLPKGWAMPLLAGGAVAAWYASKLPNDGAMLGKASGGIAAALTGGVSESNLAGQTLALAGNVAGATYRKDAFVEYKGLATEMAYRTFMSMTDDDGVAFSDILGEPFIAIAAEVVGVLSAGAETVGLNAVLSHIPGVKALGGVEGAGMITSSLFLRPTILRGVLSGLADAFASYTSEVGTEMAERAINIGGEEFLKWQVDRRGRDVEYASAEEWAGAIIEEGIGAGISFFAGAFLLPGAMNVAVNTYQVKAAQNNKALYERMVKVAEESAGLRRDPEAGTRAVNEIVHDSPAETTYISAEHFVEVFQQVGADPIEAAKHIGVSENDLQEALATDGRISVPTGDFAAKVAGTEAGRLLIKDVTFDQEGMTLREAETVQLEMIELVSKAQSEAQKAMEADAALRSDMEYVRTSVMTQAIAVGRDAREAEAIAGLYEARGKVVMSRYGVGPRAWFDSMGLTMQDGVALEGGYPQLVGDLSHENKLAGDVAAWEKTVDSFSSGKLSQKRPFRVMTTPIAMLLADGDISFKEIITNKSILEKVLKEKHVEVTPELLKQVPAALADPVMVFKSATVPGSYVSMLELRDTEGGTIVVPVALNASEPGKQAFMTSVYGQINKKSDGTVRINDQWFVDQINKGNLRYINTKKSANWARDGGLQLPIMSLPAEALSNLNIPTEADLVKARTENPGYYQQIKGQTTFSSGRTMISLFESADRSTLLHETGHVFLEDLRSIAKTNDKAAGDWEALLDWLKVDDWDSLDQKSRKVAHERFARSFEGYIMTEKAPTMELLSVFRAFRKWLVEIYRNIKGLSEEVGMDVSLSDDAKDLFDRMLATDDEISQAKVLADYVSALENTESSIELHIAADDKASEIVTKVSSVRSLREMRERLRGQVEEMLQESKGYTALSQMQKSDPKKGLKMPEQELIDRYGEAFFKNEIEPRKISSKNSKWTLDDLALRLGYVTGDKLVNEVVSLKPLHEAVDAQVDSMIRTETTQEALSAESAMRNEERLAALVIEGENIANGLNDEGYRQLEALIDGVYALDPDNGENVPGWVKDTLEAREKDSNPLSRGSVIAKIKENGGLDYQGVVSVLGKDAAKELMLRSGPGIFSKGGRDLWQLSQDLKEANVPVESAQDLYDILMSKESDTAKIPEIEINEESLPWIIWTLGEKESEVFLKNRRRDLRAVVKDSPVMANSYREEMNFIEAALPYLKDVEFEPIDVDLRSEVTTAIKEIGGLRFDLLKEAWGDKARALQQRVGPGIFKKLDEGNPENSGKSLGEVLDALRDRGIPIESEEQLYEVLMTERTPGEVTLRSVRRSSEKSAKLNRGKLWERTQLSREQVRKKVEAARKAASESLRMKVATKISPSPYIAAEKRAQKSVARALRNGNFEEAQRQKDIQIINAALAFEAGHAKIEVKKIHKYLAKMAKRDKPGGIGVEYNDKIQAILGQFSLRKKLTTKQKEELKGFSEWKAEQEKLGEVVIVPDRLVGGLGQIKFDDLTMEDLRELRDSIKNLEHLGRTKNTLLTNKNKRDFDAVVEEVVATIEKNVGVKYPLDITPNKTAGQKATAGLREVHAAHTRIEFLLRKLDANQDIGTVWDALFRPTVDAQAKETVMREEAAKELQRLFDLLGKSSFTKEIYYPEVGIKLSKEGLLAIALNMGNEGNRDRLFSGNGWTEPQVMSILSGLSSQDWAFVQGVWDFVDSYWPEVEALEKEMTGVAPKKVERSPFIVVNAKGEEISLEGGYYPIAYDSSKNTRAWEIDEKKKVEDAMSMQFYRAQTKHGHTEKRAEHVEMILDLHLSVLSRHVQELLHDLTHRRAVRDVGKLLADRRIAKAFTDAVGSEQWRELKPWLQHIAAGRDASPLTWWEKVISRGRRGVTIATLGLKPTTAIMQVMSIFGAADRIGSLRMLHSIWDFYSDPSKWKGKVEFVHSRSTEIRDRKRNFDRDVGHAMNQNLGKGKKARLEATYFYLAGMMDAAAVIPVWIEAYNMKLSETGNEKTSIYYADSVIRQTQPANSLKDLPSVMRGHETRKLFTMFYSYWNVFYNLWASRLGTKKKASEIPKLAALFLWTVAVPAILGPLLTRRGPDDDEDFAEWALKQTALYPFNAMVGVRDIASYVASPQWGYKLTPASRAFESAGRLVIEAGKMLNDDSEWEDLIRPVVDVVGIWGGFPSDQARITVGQLAEYISGEESDYHLADLFFRKRR